MLRRFWFESPSRKQGEEMASRLVNDERLVDLLYEATGDENLWPEFLAALLKRLNGRMAAFISHSPAAGKYPLVVSIGADPELQHLYGKYYGAQDPWVLAGEKKLIEGWVERGSSLCPPGQVVKTEFYNDFYHRYSHFYPLGAIIERRGDDRTFLTIMRDRVQADFSDSDVEFVRHLFPHLQRALRLYRKTQDLQFAASAGKRLLDGLDLAVIGLSNDGRIQFTNRSAEVILRSGRTLSVKDGRITARDARSDAALSALIKAACSQASYGVQDKAVAIYDRGRVLHIGIFRYTSGRNVFPEVPRVLLTITDPGACPSSRRKLLSSLFALTGAENLVMELLLSGLEPKEIAHATRTTENTVRSHLKSIYEKTGVTRQSQLIRLVSRIPGSDFSMTPRL
jgi:DNA-binding CsgD family transcriptional regulator